MRRLLLFAVGFAAAALAVAYGCWPLLLLGFLPLIWTKRRLVGGLIAVFGGVCCLFWVMGYGYLNPAPTWETSTVTIEGEVLDFPWETTSGSGCIVRLTGDRQKSVVYLDEAGMDLRPGDRVSGTGLYIPIGEMTHEQQQYYRAEAINGLYFLTTIVMEPVDEIPFYCWPAHWCHGLREQIAKWLPEETEGIIQAVVTGDKSLLPGSDYDAIIRVGIAHEVAVSGMHLTILALFIGQLLGRYNRPGAIVTLIILWLFALLVGATPSVIRAVVVQSVLLLAGLVQRENDRATTLSFALLLLLIQNPYAITSVGLQLSFAATAGIMVVASPFSAWCRTKWPVKHRLVRSLQYLLIATLSTTVGASLFTIPLTALHFQTVSLVAVVANLLTVPVVTWVFLSGLLLGCLGGLWWVFGAGLSFVAHWSGSYLLWVAGHLSRWPFASVTTDSIYILCWLGYGYLMVLAVTFLKGWKRPWVPLGCGLSTLCVALLLTHFDYVNAPLTMTVLDVGQGQGVVIHTDQRVAMVDCGGNGDDAGDLAADYLSDRGIDHLDLLVLSHFHDDHVNGVPTLLTRMSVDMMLIPYEAAEDDGYREEIVTMAEAQGTQIVEVTDNTYFTLGGAQMTAYAPLGSGGHNESGLTLLCETAHFSALFTGDMDETIEKRLVKYNDLPQVDLLMAGHHGAKTSTSQLLLDTVQPDMVCISVGENNYGHPNGDTMDRIWQSGCDIYRTDAQGNITIQGG